MAIEIVRESAQDEVCVEIWDVLQLIKSEAASALLAMDDARADNLFRMLSRVGNDYRHHAETSPSLWARHTAAIRDFDEENPHWTTMELPRPNESGVTVSIDKPAMGTALNAARVGESASVALNR